jgi:hypothetical protein
LIAGKAAVEAAFFVCGIRLAGEFAYAAWAIIGCAEVSRYANDTP